jgi:hypothetical protein
MARTDFCYIIYEGEVDGVRMPYLPAQSYSVKLHTNDIF